MAKERYIFDGGKALAQRKKRGMTRICVADTIGIPVRTLYYFESGRRNMEYLDGMNRLAEVYGCFLDDFLQDGYQLR